MLLPSFEAASWQALLTRALHGCPYFPPLDGTPTFLHTSHAHTRQHGGSFAGRADKLLGGWPERVVSGARGMPSVGNGLDNKLKG